MKNKNLIKPLTLIIVIFININSYSQYQSLFGNEQTSWNIMHSQLLGKVLDSIVYEKDTIMSGLEYKKVKRFIWHSILKSNLAKDENTFNVEYLYITEDLNTGKAFYKIYDDMHGWREYQIYDVSLNEGDSYNFKGRNINVEHIEVIDNIKHIYFDYYVNSDTMKLIMIEGVGPNTGILSHDVIRPVVLLCQEKDGEKTYINDYGIYSGHCNFDDIDLSIDKESGNKPNIYPNPSNSIINIEDANGGNITILNMLGQEILKIANISDNQKVDVSHLNPGTYYIKILKDNSIFTSKVVVTR